MLIIKDSESKIYVCKVQSLSQSDFFLLKIGIQQYANLKQFETASLHLEK